MRNFRKRFFVLSICMSILIIGMLTVSKALMSSKVLASEKDDHSSTQKSITPAATTKWIYGPAGGVTQIPEGETVLTDTLVIENQFGPVIQGMGRFKSRITWKGPPGKPVIAFRSCNHPILQDLTIYCHTPCRSAVCVSTSPKPTVTNTAALIQRVWFECSNNATDCIEINNSADGGSDNNGEHHRIYDCQLNDFKRNGVGIYTTQSHRCEISHCQIKTSNKPGTTGVFAQFGSQTMDHCNGGGLDLVFFGSDQYAGVGEVLNNNFENCKRFVDCRLPRGQWIIENNRCDGMLPFDCNDQDINKTAVFAHAGGYTSFKNNFLASQNKVPVRLLFDWNNGLEFVGNRFNGQPHLTIKGGTPDSNREMTWKYNIRQNEKGAFISIPKP